MAYGQEYYISANAGDDIMGDGSKESPWATVQHAIDAIYAQNSDNSLRVQNGKVVGEIIRGTIYDLTGFAKIMGD